MHVNRISQDILCKPLMCFVNERWTFPVRYIDFNKRVLGGIIKPKENQRFKKCLHGSSFSCTKCS